MISVRSHALLACLSLTLPSISWGATCSCAGVPLLSAMDSSSTEPGDLFINFNSEVHQISTLIQGTKEIRDQTGLQRESFSNVISASYGISQNWSISGLVSHIEHTRKVGISTFGSQSASGLGDSVLLARYTPIHTTPFSRHELSFGLGARIPTGEDEAGGLIILSEDMQPSIGAWGGIVWSGYSYAFNQAATVQFNASVNYTYNKDNARHYGFGNDFNFALGMSHSLGEKFAYSAALRYRKADADKRSGAVIPNTGGQWLDFVPALQYALTDDLNIAVSGRIPVARDLKGVLQFTTSYSYSLSMTYAY